MKIFLNANEVESIEDNGNGLTIYFKSTTKEFAGENPTTFEIKPAVYVEPDVTMIVSEDKILLES